jgi:5-methylcytosine-specific restriction endonuclease McrA
MLTKKEINRLEKRERNRKDKEWSRICKERDGFKCVICGETKLLNSHHIIVREIKEFRWDIDNAITLCAGCHQFRRTISAHSNSFAFHEWFIKNRPEQYKKLKQKWEKYGKKEIT